MIIEKYHANISEIPEVSDSITVFRDYWDKNTLDLFKNYYMTHVYQNLEDLLDKNISQGKTNIDYNLSNNHEKYISVNRLSLGMEVLSLCIMQSLCEYLCDYLDLEVIPGYAYVGLHLPGSLLKKHTDNPVGEYVISMPLYTENLQAPWPFVVGDCEVNLQPGDFVLYDGQIPHYRNTPLPENAFSINLFMLFTHSQSNREVDRYKQLYSQAKGYTNFIFNGKIADFITQEWS